MDLTKTSKENIMQKKYLRILPLLDFKRNNPLSTSSRRKYKTGWVFSDDASRRTRGYGGETSEYKKQRQYR